MNKVRKGDEVIVTAGKDKNKRGVVRSWLDENHVIIDGINVVKKHVKPNPMKGEQGGILTKEMPINISNVSLFNPSTQKADRVGFKALDDGRKVRVFKSNGEIIVKA
ncbi:50S ribosomal protein L24 [Rugosibacter aromaticivorans]|uniref:Large ribosomal subunit protein uL24 n=1 Tax=Rugosibacter aromaticivorans TaxID=1565605 RepID=A0A0C5J1R0_9PROT|nr:50S ribosomal protein L24 [Rugosibacter aromaticivorans]AJP49027.1 50S ribosomal protein L24 [Rugosibacter aromaticivorans]TBR16235.1 MAG: 50S ribosomal protein L24 [Rugosibacter sp.]